MPIFAMTHGANSRLSKRGATSQACWLKTSARLSEPNFRCSTLQCRARVGRRRDLSVLCSCVSRKTPPKSRHSASWIRRFGRWHFILPALSEVVLRPWPRVITAADLPSLQKITVALVEKFPACMRSLFDSASRGPSKQESISQSSPRIESRSR